MIHSGPLRTVKDAFAAGSEVMYGDKKEELSAAADENTA